LFLSFLGAFFDRPALLGRHLAGLFLGQRNARRGRRLPVLHVRQAEIDLFGVTELGPDVVHGVDVFTVDLQRELVLAKWQASVEIMALLVGLDLVVSLDVLAVDLDQGIRQGLAVLVLYITFERRSLRQRSCREKQRQSGADNKLPPIQASHSGPSKLQS